jgi:hypothetical protein
MKGSKSIELVLIFILLINMSVVKANNASIESYGVEEGELLKFAVIERPERPEWTQGMELPGGTTVEDFTKLGQIQLDNYTLQPVFESIPPKDNNFSVNIESLPNYTKQGVINVSYNTTDFMTPINNKLGEPIISRDWEMWIQVLEFLSSQEYVYDKKVESVDYKLTNKTLTSKIVFKPSIPSNMALFITKMTINQTQSYYISTGIQAYMAITTLTTMPFFGDFTSVLFYKYLPPDSGGFTNDSDELTSINIPTNEFNVMQIILPLLGGTTIVVLVIIGTSYVIRRRLKT